MDDDLKNLLESSYEEGLLKKSIVVILGDHGQRIDRFRSTEMGKIEDFMPFVSFIFPKGSKTEILKNWKKSMIANSNRLTSSYDLHKTFLDILSTLDVEGKGDVNGLKNHGLGLSLFSQIPTNRTCYAAGIPEWYCTCTNVYENATALKLDHPKAMSSAEIVIDEINKKLIAQTNLCSKLTLHKVTKALYSELTKRRYRIHITFVTKPSDGLFESILEVNLNKTYKIIGEIIRLNLYGSQSNCLPKHLISEEFFKSTCHCKDKSVW